nr:hypothetical protein [Marinobacter sediminum]
MLKASPIANAGQWVVIGQPLKRLFVPFTLGQIDADGQDNAPAFLILDDGAGPIEVDRESLIVGELCIYLDNFAFIFCQQVYTSLERFSAITRHKQLGEIADRTLKLLFEPGIAGKYGAVQSLCCDEQVGAVDQPLEKSP